MLAEILWLLTELKSDGLNVNGETRTPVCERGAGTAAADLDPLQARISGLGATLSLLRGSDEAPAETASCELVLPLSITEGHYPAQVEAELTYSIAKSLRTEAKVSVQLNLAGFYQSRFTRSYPRGSFYEPESTFGVTIDLAGDTTDARNLRRAFCRRPDYPAPVGVDITLEGTRERPSEELRLGEGALPYVTLKAGKALRCAAEDLSGGPDGATPPAERARVEAVRGPSL